jgi:hypothetical protein
VTLNGDEIRRNMLQILYAQTKKAPEEPWLTRETLCMLLVVTGEELDEIVSHFEGQGLLEVEGALYENVRLSSKGVFDLDARMKSYCPNL